MNIIRKPVIYIFMELKNNFFIAVYTNECKDYCDEEFFENLLKLKNNNYLGIVDNTIGDNYFKKLRKLAPTAAIKKVNPPIEPNSSLFQRNVTESVNSLRDDFLKIGKDYFLIIESDVLPPLDLLNKLQESINYLDNLDYVIEDVKPWGIIGGLYYDGFHDYNLKGLNKKSHILSGCTLYKRELIEKYPFRYDPDNLGPFPDAWICVDAGKEYSLWNNHDIICNHLHTKSGTRMSKPIWTKA